MGVRAGLTEIPPDVFEQVIAGGEPMLPHEPRHSIDKSWHDFHVVFRAKGPPHNLAIAGDHPHPQTPCSLDEFCEGNHEYYMGFVSPQLVREIGAVLSTLTASDYKQWERELIGDQYNCGEMFFAKLKDAYTAAAARQRAVMVVIC